MSGTSIMRSGLDWYLDKIKGTPLLTAEQERQLALRIREHSDHLAREQMINANLRLVVKIAKEYSNPCMTLGDLVAEGNLGLMRAVEEFDPHAGVRFSTYASWWIKQTIKRALINGGQPIYIPAYLSKLIKRWRSAAATFERKHGRPPGADEIAAVLKISHKKAEMIYDGLKAINAPSQMMVDETQGVSDVIEDTNGKAPEQGMLDAANAPFVKALLKSLPEREQKILELRFALDGYDGPPRTYKQIGKVIGLTRERVRQLEREALDDLKKLLDEKF